MRRADEDVQEMAEIAVAELLVCLADENDVANACLWEMPTERLAAVMELAWITGFRTAEGLAGPEAN